MITGYIVRVKETQTETEFNLTTSALNVSVGDLKAFTMYQFNVASFTEVGVGPYSSDVTVTTHQTGILYYTILSFSINHLMELINTCCISLDPGRK